MSRIVRVGSRDSVLAVKQARIVMDAVKRDNPNIEPELITLKTTGDKIQDKSLDKIGGKGLFTKELEQALLEGRIDIAVHSYKDMPYEQADGLPIVALSERDSPFDVLVLPEGVSELDKSKPVGSSSMRRSIQLKRLITDCEIMPVRGNVLTRIAKLDKGEYSALILAEAGLNRLSMQHRISRVFSADEMIPSGSQGILAVQGRSGEDYSYLSGFHCLESEIVSNAERAFLKTLGASCSSPVAVYGQLSGEELSLAGMCVDESGSFKKGMLRGCAGNAAQIGINLALQLKERLAKQ